MLKKILINNVTVTRTLRELLIGETTQHLYCTRRSSLVKSIITCAFEVTMFHYYIVFQSYVINYQPFQCRFVNTPLRRQTRLNRALSVWLLERM